MPTPYTHLKHRINEFEKKYARAENSVQLLAVGKNQPIEKLLSLYSEGQRAFGENYLQEALQKIPNLPQDIIWHFIGPIQSNKTRKIAEHFSWVHSVASFNIAKRLSEQRPNHLPPLNICIEVNVDQEESKSGVSISDVAKLVAECLTLPNIHVRGLMTIPAATDDFTKQCLAFKKLAEISHNLPNIDTLSMGMSNDLEAAIKEGATFVRIGRALFSGTSSS